MFGGASTVLPPPLDEFVALAGGRVHSVGLKSDGTIVTWRQNEYGQCNVPSPNAGFVRIATPILLESWTASSLPEGLQIRWEVSLGTTGALYRVWRDPAAGPHDMAPTPEAVLVSTAWISASADGIIETLDREAPRGAAVRYFLEMSANGAGFIGPVAARWDPPALTWSAGPTPFRGTVQLALTGEGPARGEIFDSAGRLVRTVLRAAGSTPMSWDGRDDAGRKAPAGVYLVKVSTPAGETKGRVVLTK